MDNIFFYIIELFGTITFSVSGALIGIRRRIDLLGIVICAMTTATGGGIIRDILLGRIPPATLINPTNIFIAIVVALISCVYARKLVKLNQIAKLSMVYEITDALGLGAFVVSGINVAIAQGYGDNLFLIIFAGTLTGVGGGLLRDAMLGRVAAVLKSDDLVATSAIISSTYYAFLIRTDAMTEVAVILTILLAMLIRIASIVYNLYMPKIRLHKDESPKQDEQTK